MNTTQHKKAFNKLTDDFAALVTERREVERQHNAFQTAFKNPFSDEMKSLNERWDAKLVEIRAAAAAAVRDGVRHSTVSKWLDCVGTWNAIKDIQEDALAKMI